MSVMEPKKAKMERLRFSHEDDFILLREVIANNPFQDHLTWGNVHSNVVEASERPFTLRAVKERVDYLLKLFNKDDWNYRKERTARKEDYDEKERLLQEVIEMRSEFKLDKPPNQYKLREKGIFSKEMLSGSCSSSGGEYIMASEDTLMPEVSVIKSEPLEELVEVTENEIQLAPCQIPSANSRPAIFRPTYARKARSSAYLNMQNRNGDNKLRIQQLKLEEKKLAVEEKKIELEERKLVIEEAKLQAEKCERQLRIERERKERESIMELIDKQNKIMSLFIKHLDNVNK